MSCCVRFLPPALLSTSSKRIGVKGAEEEEEKTAGEMAKKDEEEEAFVLVFAALCCVVGQEKNAERRERAVGEMERPPHKDGQSSHNTHRASKIRPHREGRRRIQKSRKSHADERRNNGSLM